MTTTQKTRTENLIRFVTGPDKHGYWDGHATADCRDARLVGGATTVADSGADLDVTWPCARCIHVHQGELVDADTKAEIDQDLAAEAELRRHGKPGGKPKQSVTPDEALAVAEAFVAGLPAKMQSVSDFIHAAESTGHDPKVLMKGARQYARRYDGDFEFMVSMREAAETRPLSAAMAKGVLNCLRNDVSRRAKADRNETPTAAPTEAKPERPTPTGVDISGIPEGLYATPEGDVIRVDQPEGRWAGWTFVKAGEEKWGERLGKQRPDGTYEGEQAEILAEIAKDPAAYCERFGRLTGKCGMCSRTLTDPESIDRGIGPVCARKRGWAS